MPTRHDNDRNATRDPLMTRAEAAAYLRLRPTSLQSLYAQNRGPRVIKLGPHRQSRVRYAKSDLDAWLARPTDSTPSRPSHCQDRFPTPAVKGRP